jgi:hypothetical protein
MAKTKKAAKAAAALPADTYKIGSRRRLNIALDATVQMEALFGALLEHACAIEDVDDCSVIKALAFRGAALSSAAWTVLGDDSPAAADQIEDLERAVLFGQ